MNNLFDYLEAFKNWTYDNGIVYITGRDIYALIIGALLSFCICAFIYVLITKEGD